MPLARLLHMLVLLEAAADAETAHGSDPPSLLEAGGDTVVMVDVLVAMRFLATTLAALEALGVNGGRCEVQPPCCA